MTLPKTPRYFLDDSDGMPRYLLDDLDGMICPWCQCEDILSESALYDDEHFECTHCGKSYNYVVDDKGDAFIEGMNTEADQKYVDWLAARNASLEKVFKADGTLITPRGGDAIVVLKDLEGGYG